MNNMHLEIANELNAVKLGFASVVSVNSVLNSHYDFEIE